MGTAVVTTFEAAIDAMAREMKRQDQDSICVSMYEASRQQVTKVLWAPYCCVIAEREGQPGLQLWRRLYDTETLTADAGVGILMEEIVRWHPLLKPPPLFHGVQTEVAAFLGPIIRYLDQQWGALARRSRGPIFMAHVNGGAAIAPRVSVRTRRELSAVTGIEETVEDLDDDSLIQDNPPYWTVPSRIDVVTRQ